MTPDTVLGVYAGRFYSTRNDDDAEAAYWKLRRQAMLYDVPERPVEIAGPDVVAFLERVFSRRISDLKIGRGRYAIACAHNGGLFIDGVLFRLAEDRFWYVQPDGPLETWLLAHSAGFDVTVSDPKSRVLQIQGPASMQILHAATEGTVTEELGYFHSGFFSVGGQQVYLSRTGWTGEMGYEIYTQGAATDCGKLWDHLIAVGLPFGMGFGSLQSMGIRRIEAGILDSGSDFDLTMNPFEAGLGSFIDLNKPDFIGREALMSAPRGTRLFGVTCAEVAPGALQPIFDGEMQVGRVTVGAFSPFLKSGIGYARMHAVGDWMGRTLSIRLASGQSVPCKIVDLPFYDPEKRIPRGLDRTIP